MGDMSHLVWKAQKVLMALTVRTVSKVLWDGMVRKAQRPHEEETDRKVELAHLIFPHLVACKKVTA